MRYAVFSGNLGRNWEAKKIGDNTVYETTMAVDYKVKNEEKTMWIKLSQWGDKPGAILSQYTQKGSKLLVRGEIDVRAYESKLGEPTAEIQLRMDGFDLIDSKKKEEGPVATPPELEDEIPFS